MQTIKCDVKLFPWLVAVLNSINEFPHDIHVVKSKRQVGKSTIAELIILKYALEKPRSKNFYLSPTYRQCRKVFEDIANVIRDTIPVRKINNTSMEIYFVNDSKISFFSAEQSIESLQGYVCNGILICDESAFIDDEVFHAVLPYVDVNKAPMLIISTPVFKQGFFYDLFDLGINHTVNNVHSIDFSKYDTSPLLSPEKLEYYRKTLPKIKFIQQYLGEFCDLSGCVFGEFSECLTTKPEMIPENVEIVFGVDWATGTSGDSTVITVWDKNHKAMIDLLMFNDKDATDTISYLFTMIEIYRPTKIMVESNSIGEIFVLLIRKELLKRRCSTLLLVFNTTNASKEKIVNLMLVAIQNDDVKLLYDDELIKQFSAFEAKQSSCGKVIYGNAKDSIHDDIVMASCIGLNCCLLNSYTIL